MGLAEQAFRGASDVFVQMAHKKMTPGSMDDYLTRLYPPTESQKKHGKKPSAWASVMEMFEGAPDLQREPVRGTLWAAYNAVTAHEDHHTAPNGDTPARRLNRIWFGSGAGIKLAAFMAAQEMLK